jgi:hypothetical protein
MSQTITTFFQVQDHEALAILIRFTEAQGEKVLQVRPLNETFVVQVSGEVEITSHTDLRPFKFGGVDIRRTFWADIAEIHESAIRLLSVFDLEEAH